MHETKFTWEIFCPTHTWSTQTSEHKSDNQEVLGLLNGLTIKRSPGQFLLEETFAGGIFCGSVERVWCSSPVHVEWERRRKFRDKEREKSSPDCATLSAASCCTFHPGVYGDKGGGVWGGPRRSPHLIVRHYLLHRAEPSILVSAGRRKEGSGEAREKFSPDCATLLAALCCTFHPGVCREKGGGVWGGPGRSPHLIVWHYWPHCAEPSSLVIMGRREEGSEEGQGEVLTWFCDTIGHVMLNLPSWCLRRGGRRGLGRPGRSLHLIVWHYQPCHAAPSILVSMERREEGSGEGQGEVLTWLCDTIGCIVLHLPSWCLWRGGRRGLGRPGRSPHLIVWHYRPHLAAPSILVSSGRREEGSWKGRRLSRNPFCQCFVFCVSVLCL